MISLTSSLSALAFASSAAAATVPVVVGNGGLEFAPSTVTAAVGDVIEFTFDSRHNVVQSAFNSPCISTDATKIFSGVLSTGKFSVKVNSTDPLWLYCSVGRHCQSGMVMVVNPPASGDTLAAYKSAAASVSQATSPDAVTGGILGDASAFGSSAATTPAAGNGTAAATTSPSTSAVTPVTTMSMRTAAVGTTTTTSTPAAAATGGAAEKGRAVGVVGALGLAAALLA